MMPRMVIATTKTDATCDTGCWKAKQPVCVCSCNGKNHGVLLRDGVEQPVRTRQVKGARYELEAVVIGYYDAKRYARDRATDAELVGSASTNWARPDWIVASATASQIAKWSELDTYKECDTRYAKDTPHLVWRRAIGRPG